MLALLHKWNIGFLQLLQLSAFLYVPFKRNRFSFKELTILWFNKIGATYIIANPIFHAWTEHVEINSFCMRSKRLKDYFHLQ